MNPHDDDLATPPEIEARLRSVDSALPPNPAWHAPADEAGLLRVVSVRRASRGPSVAAVLVALVVLAGAVLLLGRVPGSPVGASQGPGSSSVAGSGAAPSAGASGAPLPGALPGSAVEVLRGSTAGDALVIQRLRWGACELAGSFGATVAPDAAAIDAAADAQGIEAGWLDGVPASFANIRQRFWLGEDVVDLAIANGSRLVAIGGRSDVWMASSLRASRWVPMVTPVGRTAWWETATSIAPTGSCASATPFPQPVAGVLSLTCTLDQSSCAPAVEAARRLAPEAFGPGVAVVVAHACGPPMRCAIQDAGTEPASWVVAIPAGWRSLDDIRVFTAGWTAPSAGAMEVVMGNLPAHVLALVSRASLPLPVSPAPSGIGAQSCRTARLEGGLTGSPWDPWGARVGSTPILWPAGFSARFVPDLEVIGPDGDVVAREGDLMVIGGAFESEESDRFSACFVNGTVYPGR